jgi:hypothetical protein
MTKALMGLIHAYAEAHGADMSNVPASNEASAALKAALAQQGEQQPVAVSDAMVEAYLTAQRKTVEEADRFGRPNAGGLHTNTVREACRNGITAALTAAPAPQTQEPHVWMIQGSHGTWKGEHAEMDAKAEAKRCGGTCYAYPLYTQPAQMRILTDEQIKYMWAQYCSYPGGILDFARAIREAK